MTSSFGYGTNSRIFAYDNTVAILETNYWLSSLTTPYGTTSFTFFEAPFFKTITHKGDSLKFYVGGLGNPDEMNRACRVTHPDGSMELYAYDSAMRRKTFTSPAGTFTYNFNGGGMQVESLVMPQNTETYTYNAVGALKLKQFKKGGTVLDSHDYGYNPDEMIQDVKGSVLGIDYFSSVEQSLTHGPQVTSGISRCDLSCDELPRSAW